MRKKLEPSGSFLTNSVLQRLGTKGMEKICKKNKPEYSQKTLTMRQKNHHFFLSQSKLIRRKYQHDVLYTDIRMCIRGNKVRKMFFRNSTLFYKEFI